MGQSAGKPWKKKERGKSFDGMSLGRNIKSRGGKSKENEPRPAKNAGAWGGSKRFLGGGGQRGKARRKSGWCLARKEKLNMEHVRVRRCYFWGGAKGWRASSNEYNKALKSPKREKRKN